MKVSKFRKMYCSLMRLKYRLKVVINEWRYKRIFRCFATIDKYFPREDINKACQHIETWAGFKSQDAKLCESFRQKYLGLKIVCLRSGISEEAIDLNDWTESALGINIMDPVLSQEIGQEVIDYIISAGLVRADQENLSVWSANAASQIRSFILERLFCADQNK